jgi:hypothetical protein
MVATVMFVFAAPAHAAALTQTQIQAIVTLLQSFGADATTVANVTASLNGQAPSAPSTPSTPSSCGFTRDLTVGSSGADVTCLQTALIAAGRAIPAGATGYFGSQTQSAVMKWQAAAGVTPAAGYFGSKSRAAFGSTTSTGPSPVPAGTGLSVMAGIQPANSLAPTGASRVPFTRITLTAGNDGDVTVTGVQIQRTGLGSDAAFDGVILVDESTGMQLGNSQTFNSNHQSVIGGTFMLSRGTSRSYLVAGNMTATSPTSYSGQAPAISVIGINTSATVSGSLPIMGAFQTYNATLTVGSATLATSNAFASNSNQTVNIGDTMRKTTGLRLTAGSAEDITLKMVRFNQTGSVSATDLANVAVMIGANSYPLVVSADGKYYSATLGSGVLLAKGNQVDMYVTYDVVGGNANGRTVIFDIDRTTDILSYGNTYGYGISPAAGSASVPTTRGTETVTSGSPYVYATQDTIQGASITTISKSNDGAGAAQNIAINVPNQPLGSFIVDLKGESVTVQQMIFSIASTTGSGNGLLTNVTLVDENGSVVSGPYDGACGTPCSTTQTVTMSSSVTFPTGRHVYHLKGKVASNIGGGGTYKATTIPSGWSNVRGNTSGNTVSLAANGTFDMNPMTVKAGSLVIGPSSSLTSQNLVPGGQQVEFARFSFDAGQSGEDVRISSVPAALTSTNSVGSATDLTSCQLYDGANSITTGSNTVNPTQAASSTNTFTLDNPKTITKGTVFTASLKCNVSGSAINASNYVWTPGTVNANGSVASFVGSFTVTGAVSGTTISATQGSGTAATFTIAAGTFTATAAGASIAQPSRTFAAAGTTGVTIGYIKLRATNEAVNLTKIGLTLANGVYGTLSRGNGGSSASGTGDVVVNGVQIYNGATLVGTANFISGQVATSTFSSAVSLGKDVDTVLTIKADLAQIGQSAPGGIGDLIKIDPLNAEGVGASSGVVSAIGATAGVSGVQLVKSFPTLALGTGACVGNGCNGPNQILKVFKVTANAAGPVSVYQAKIVIATSSAQLFDPKLYVYDESGNLLSSTAYGTASGQFGTTVYCAAGTGCTSNNPTLTFTGTIPVQVPVGPGYTFKLLGTVTPTASATNWSVISTVQGDTAAQTGLGGTTTNGYIATSTANVATANFIWGNNATGTPVVGDVDWFNGFQVPGLSGTGI